MNNSWFFLTVWPIFSTCLMYQYHYVNVSLNWTEAQTFCRERYIDLSDIWIGLYGNIHWVWFDGYIDTGYRNWENCSERKLYPADQWCVNIGNGGKWRNDNCSLTHPFICFTGEYKENSIFFSKKDDLNVQLYER
uniref:C-type lectin domain-containing protein n=1 Tax=Lates calcarifer TaxID=8187 RepID=A0A4W6DGY9_LATCA